MIMRGHRSRLMVIWQRSAGAPGCADTEGVDGSRFTWRERIEAGTQLARTARKTLETAWFILIPLAP